MGGSGKERESHMAEFEYVHKKEYYPVKHEQKTILDRVVSIMQREYDLPGVRYRLIGSGDSNKGWQQRLRLGLQYYSSST